MSAHPDFVLISKPRESPPTREAVSELESDHRIANHLAMIASIVRVEARALAQGEALSPQEARKKLEEIALRIEAVGSLHRSLAGAPGTALQPAAYLQNLGELTMRALDPQNRITVTYDLAECGLMSGERLAALGLLVNEALVNSMKYAHPAGVRGLLQLSCRPVFGNSVLVAVEDDGVGLPSGVDHLRGGGMGFRIMRALAEQLGAMLTCRSSALGLTVQVIAPI